MTYFLQNLKSYSTSVFFSLPENILQGLSNAVAPSLKLSELENPFGEGRDNIYKVRIVQARNILQL